MTYIPRRDDRFEYIWEVMQYVEDRQCNTCQFKSDRPDYAMCLQIEAELVSEEPVEALDDRGNDGVVCTLYKPQEAKIIEPEVEDTNQLRLF